MNKKLYFIAATFTIALASCTDDELIKEPGIPVVTGDEIMFGSTLNKDNSIIIEGNKKVASRTYYGERTETGIPVYWEEGGTDTIAIFCPQASAPSNHLVNYKIVPNVNAPANSSGVINVDPNSAGLQWGSEGIHKFFALYPSSIVKQADTDDQAGKITASLPSMQQPTGWRTTFDGLNRKKVYRAEPNMDYAFMFAYNKVDRDTMTTNSFVPLKFQNLVTVLDITIPGPDNGTATVTNINVDVLDGTNRNICGDFYIDIADADREPIGHVDCTHINNNKINNRISIPCFGDIDNDPSTENSFVTLGANDALNVKAYIIPDNEYDKNALEYREFKITVAYLNGASSQITLGKNDSGTTTERVIVPHKINRILLPKLEVNAEPDLWMKNLDNNIYLSELSIPGSKFSYLTKENVKDPKNNPAYQTKDIEGQFKDGVRAFIVQTGATPYYNVNREYIGGIINPKYKYTYDFQKCETMPVLDASEGTTLETTIKKIKYCLDNAESECAYLVLTCDGNTVKPTYSKNYDGQPGVGWTRGWIESVEYKLNKLKTKYPIYEEEITPNTTLGDVRGKIIVKVNYNDFSQEEYIDKNAKVPALFGIWKQPTSEDLAPASNLLWGTPNPKTSRQTMYWLCQEATHVGHEISPENKEKAIVELFRKSIVAYNERDQHDVWFMNDLGGSYYTKEQGYIYKTESSTKLALKMNGIAVEDLQARKENASTGLVFMNFADRDANSGALYKSDWLLATIIDNNFKFALRKRPSGN